MAIPERSFAISSGDVDGCCGGEEVGDIFEVDDVQLERFFFLRLLLLGGRGFACRGLASFGMIRA